MNATTSIGINKWSVGREIFQVWASGEGEDRLIGWQSANGERAIETNGDPAFEGDPGFDHVWEKMNATATAAATATVTDGLTGGWDPMSGDWHAGRGERIKPVVLAAISAALSVAGVNYPVDVELFHADGRAIADDLPASGTWVATRR